MTLIPGPSVLADDPHAEIVHVGVPPACVNCGAWLEERGGVWVHVEDHGCIDAEPCP